MTKYVVAVLVALVSVGCGLFSGYGSGYGSGYYPSASTYGTYGMLPVGYGGYGAGYGGGYIAPPPPPSALAFVNGNGFPGFYRDTPRDVRVINNTDYYWKIRFSAAEMGFTEMGVPEPPFIPARQEAHFYAPFTNTDPRTGCEHHHLDLEGYLFPDLQNPVIRTGKEVVFCAGWEDGQVIRLGGF